MREISNCGFRIADSGKPAERIADSGLRIADSGKLIDARASASPNPQSAIRNPQFIELHIEELVLHGFAPGDRYQIADAVERELARSFARQGLSPSLMNGIEIARIDGGVFRVAGGAKAQTVGSQVAKAVYGGLTR